MGITFLIEVMPILLTCEPQFTYVYTVCSDSDNHLASNRCRLGFSIINLVGFTPTLWLKAVSRRYRNIRGLLPLPCLLFRCSPLP